MRVDVKLSGPIKTNLSFLLLINLHVTAEISNNPHRDLEDETREEDLELPLFDLETVSAATDMFSFKNKIGEGGFGPVYKVITLRLFNYNIGETINTKYQIG